MESAHKSGGGGGSTPGAGGEGVLCHACGYQYPNGHPSAKQRRAHRKHCGKPTSAAAGGAEEGAGEHDGSDLLLGETGGAAAVDGNGAGAAECGGGGGSPGSAHGEPGDAAEGGGDNAASAGAGADPSGDGQVIGDKSAEDCLIISSSNIPSEITSEASRTDDGTLTTLATQHSEKGSPIEVGDPSDPAVSSEQLQGVPTSVVSPEPEDRAKFSSEISENEMQNPSIVPLESDAAGGGTSGLTNDVVQVQDGVAVTVEDGTINTIGDSKSSEGKSVQGDKPGLSCQDILQTEISVGHSSMVVEEDSGDKNTTASNNEEILSGETESDQQSKHALTESFEEVPNIEPVESSAKKSVDTEDDLLQPGKDSCHSEIPDDIKAQRQPDSTSGIADHLAISEGADNVEEQHYPTTDESIGVISSTFEPAVGANVISVDATTKLTEDFCSSGITMDDSIQENVTSGAAVPSQVDIVDLSPATAHEINMVGSTNNVDEMSQNEKSSTDLASYEVKEMVIKDNFEEKQQNREVTVDPTHEADSFASTDNHRENEKNEEIIEDTTYKISAVQSMSNTEEKEQIEEFTANLASDDINVTSNRDMVKQQDETDVKTSHEIDGACNIEATGENNATAGESNTVTITDVEDKMPNEEITSGTISLNITDISIKEEKMHNEEVNERLGSRDDIVVHEPDNVKEKIYEETTSGPTLDKFSLLTSTDSPEESKDENTSADPTSHETNLAQTSDGVDEEKNGKPAIKPTCSLGTMGSVGDAEDKKPSEETTADRTPVENTTTQGTLDAESSKQTENAISIGDAEDKKHVQETTADPGVVENTTQGTEDAESSKQNENTTSIGDAEHKKQSEETAAPRSIENATAQCTEDVESSKQNENTTTKDEAAEKVSQNTNVIEVREMVEDTASKEISTIESTDDLKGATDQNEEIADKEMVTDSDKNHVSLKVLLADKNVEAKDKEKKASTKDRVLSFRRRVSKDNVSPVKPGSPKDGSGQQDWNSPARLPVEKKPKGRKQQWVPFICCSSVQ